MRPDESCDATDGYEAEENVAVRSESWRLKSVQTFQGCDLAETSHGTRRGSTVTHGCSDGTCVTRTGVRESIPLQILGDEYNQ